MKKILLLMFVFLGGIMAQAQSTATYTDDLAVTISGLPAEPQQRDIQVTSGADGTYTLSLNNLILIAGGEPMYVGNIVVDGITTTEEGGIKKFSLQKEIFIAEGTVDINGETWIGPMLEGVNINLVGEMTDKQLHCELDIPYYELQIHVEFGYAITKDETSEVVTYTDDLAVTISGLPAEPQQRDIQVTSESDGTYTLSLNNLILIAGGEPMYVGNIVVDGIVATEEGGIKKFSLQKEIFIAEGTVNINGETWIGPMLEGVNINLVGEMTDKQLHCELDIPYYELQIHVEFGKKIIASGIRTVDAQLTDSAKVYTINGQYVCEERALEALPKGLYIVNGKKVIK